MLVALVRRTSWPWLLLAAAWAMPDPLMAATVTDLYLVTVPRSLEADNARADEQDRAMLEAITRITGSRALSLAPELEPMRSAASRYVETFGYTPDEEAEVRFIPGSIERTLTDLNLPVWGAERPLTIFWIAVTDQFGDRALLSSGEVDPGIAYGDNMRLVLEQIRTDIDDATRERGLPYVLPVLDVLDLATVDFLDVYNFELGVLAEASARYGADSIAVARVRESEIGSDVEWVMRMGFDQRSLPGASLRQGIDWLADTYAAQFAGVGGARPIMVHVTGVGDFDSYARTISYLEDLSMLDRVDIESFSDGALMLRVQSRGDAAVLARVVQLGGVLREAPTFGSQVSSGSVLNLEVVPSNRYQ
jgi:uncharacterized protein